MTAPREEAGRSKSRTTYFKSVSVQLWQGHCFPNSFMISVSAYMEGLDL